MKNMNKLLSRAYINNVASFFLFFMMRILFTSLFSVFLIDQGYSALNVSIVSTVALVASFFGVPIIGRATDIYGQKRICVFLLLISAAFGILFAISKNLIISGVSYSIIIVCINTLHPLIERNATQTEFHYSSVRIWGTIGNAIGTQLGGILYQYISPSSVYISFTIISIIMLIMQKNSSKKTIQENTNPPSKNIEPLKISSCFVMYIIIIFLFYAAMDSKTLYLTAFLQSVGFDINSASTILFFSSLIEVPVVLFGGKIVDKWDSKKLVVSCLILLIIQLTVYAFLTSHIIIIIATLLSNCVVSMFYIMINMKVIHEMIDNDHQNSALTITTGVRSISAVIGQLVCGKLVDMSSYHLAFTVLAGFVLTALFISFTIKFPHNSKSSTLYN